jgi:hypothetical protein
MANNLACEPRGGVGWLLDTATRAKHSPSIGASRPIDNLGGVARIAQTLRR